MTADDTTRVDTPRHTDDTTAARLAQIRERNRRLAAVPFETHGGGHGPGCIPCELVRAVDDVRWLLERLKVEYGVQRQGSNDASPAGDEASARMCAGLYRTPHYVMQRFVTGWQRADAAQQPEDGDRG